MEECFVVIQKHCIDLDDANKFNAKFQCTTQSYLHFLWGVNVFADFIPKTGCWIRQCWFYWPSPSESLIYLIIQINPPPSRGGHHPILFPILCFLFFLSVFGVAMASVLQYFSGQQNTERTDSIYNNSKPIVTFMKVWFRCRLFCDLCGQ